MSLLTFGNHSFKTLICKLFSNKLEFNINKYPYYPIHEFFVTRKEGKGHEKKEKPF